MFLFLRGLLEIETIVILIVACWFYDIKVKGKSPINYFFTLYAGASLAQLLYVIVKSFFKFGETGLADYIPFWFFLIISFFAHIFLIYVFKQNKDQKDNDADDEDGIDN